MRLVVISTRNLEDGFSWRNVAPPLEDALGALPDATVVAPPGLRRATLSSDVPGWFHAARTVRRADAVFWNQLHLKPAVGAWALAYVRPLAARTVYSLDAFGGVVDDLARMIDAQRLTHCFLAYQEAVDHLHARYPALPVSYLPVGFDPAVFTDTGSPRDIDVFWLGRRDDTLHRRIEELCERTGRTYRFSRSRLDPATREELRDTAARSRYFVVTPPDHDDAVRTGGFSPLTSRFLEGVGAGARLFGIAPRSGELEALFGPDALVPFRPDGSDVAEALEAADSDPAWEAKRRAAFETAHGHHTWSHRAATVYAQTRACVETT